MILDYSQLKSIILENPNKGIIDEGTKYSKDMRFHLYGEHKSSYVKKIEGFEKSNAVREEYTKTNCDLFARLGRPIDKVYSAKGGSVYYNLPDEQAKKAQFLSNNIRNGMSVKKWVQSVWQPHLLDDPFGLTFIEILPKQEAVLSLKKGHSFVYPTYKPIGTIYDYLPKGNRLEYVVFTLTKIEKKALSLDENDMIFRVVDDACDYIVKKHGNDIYIFDNLTLDNYFGEVPAMVNSDIIDPKNENCVLSFYHDIKELANQYLLKGSIKSMHDFYHGFPKYSEFASLCTTCNGMKVINGEKCTSCDGVGLKPISKVSESKVLSWPDKDDAVILPSQIGAYISPDKTYWEIATTDLQSLEDAMCVTLWGRQSNLKTQGMSISADGSAKTATEIMDDIKPEADRLHVISDMAEKRHKFILDSLIKVQVSPVYQGSSVNYGRRYMIESPDSIWEKYSAARAKGAPQNVLDDLLNEFYESKYQTDPVALAVAVKLMYVEPFVHYTAQQLKGLDASEEDYKAKLYFSEWLANVDEGELIYAEISALKQALSDYVSAKQLAIPEQNQITNAA